MMTRFPLNQTTWVDFKNQFKPRLNDYRLSIHIKVSF